MVLNIRASSRRFFRSCGRRLSASRGMEGDQLDWQLPVPNGRHDGSRIAVRLAELPRSLRPPQHSLPRRIRSFLPSPQLLHALLPFLSESKDSDTYEYLSILQSFYPSTHAFDLFYRADFPSGLLCFRELVFPAVFSSLLDDPYADSLRERGIDPSRSLRSRYGSHRRVSLLPHLREVPYAHIGGGSARNVP